MTSPTSIRARDKEHLKQLIKEHIDLHGTTCDLNHIDVSNVTDMSYLFRESLFDGNISQWNISNVKNMNGIFNRSLFNGDISQWNVSYVGTMLQMFSYSVFNGDISQWNVSSVTDMSSMFYHSTFNGDLSQWNVDNVMWMNHMFCNSTFNGDLSKWDTSRVRDVNKMFHQSAFKGDISAWNLNNILEYEDVFTTFNDSPLGYLSILQQDCAFPNDDPQVAQFETLRALCEGLNMDILSAARHIYKALHSPTSGPSEIMDHTLPVDFDIQATGSMP